MPVADYCCGGIIHLFIYLFYRIQQCSRSRRQEKGHKRSRGRRELCQICLSFLAQGSIWGTELKCHDPNVSASSETLVCLLLFVWFFFFFKSRSDRELGLWTRISFCAPRWENEHIYEVIFFPSHPHMWIDFFFFFLFCSRSSAFPQSVSRRICVVTAQQRVLDYS